MLADSPRVIIKKCFSITRDSDGDYVLADVRQDKKLGEICYLTRAIYQNPLTLISDVTTLLIKRAVFFKTVTNQDELLKEMASVALTCRDAINSLENSKGQ
ncbi:MAG TPA: DUF5405 family protein [Buttiauxella sp.]|jgi:hypothetical protein